MSNTELMWKFNINEKQCLIKDQILRRKEHLRITKNDISRYSNNAINKLESKL